MGQVYATGSRSACNAKLQSLSLANRTDRVPCVAIIFLWCVVCNSRDNSIREERKG
ncbi:hypothetical protein WN48_08944 [Eufriesea mexicana]|uniref:Uncharacterized protein n=1 Tax=Eufriesea mexicana TaxID=516756 RepID=A0A310SBL1_9HYME|nr:hypothetical protein WN48_08944 [Eufriesea mexicana]